MSLTVGSIVIRVTDLDAQLAFWTAALDYVPRQPIADDFALLGPRTGAGVGLSLDVVASPRMLPPRIHLDLYTSDQAAEVTRLERLGARRVHWSKRPPDVDYVIMEDPEGNRFCVVHAHGDDSASDAAASDAAGSDALGSDAVGE